MKETEDVSIVNGVAGLIAEPFHSLIQPDWNVWKQDLN